VDDFDEIKFGTDRLDPSSFPVKFRVNTFRQVRVSVSPFKGGAFVSIRKGPSVSAELTNIVDQNGNPVVARDQNGNILSPVFSNQDLVVAKNPALSSLDITAERTVSVGAKRLTRTVTKTTDLDLTSALPIPALAETVEIVFGADTFVRTPN